MGAGLWGQLDLSGELFEWNLDYFASSFVDPCTDCALLTTTAQYPSNVMRGGYFQSPPQWAVATFRSNYVPDQRYDGIGFRCARAP
jgi:formylglycine-generating enzyme required for sulfatase activity